MYDKEINSAAHATLMISDSDVERFVLIFIVSKAGVLVGILLDYYICITARLSSEKLPNGTVTYTIIIRVMDEKFSKSPLKD